MKPQAPDWAIVIAQIIATGMTELDISKHPGVEISVKGVRYLREGRQPFFHRGECLVRLWCERTGLEREGIPMADVLRGHRMKREARDTSPRVQNLPAFPVPVQRADLQGAKKRAARKVKEAA